ncbi:MAG: acyl-CoA synthetase [Acidobacteria bacterium]|nr:acyl-CoA synthetase [Acidobacteriota bacterium]
MYPGFHALAHPERPAVIIAETGEMVTYRELDDRSIRLANLWHDRGLRRGDRVAILLENHPRYFEVVWAALRSGLYYTPINTHLTRDEIGYILDDCEARCLVTSEPFLDRVEGLATEISLLIGADADGFDRYEDLLAAASSHPRDDQPEGSGMFYSSGTTGRPKGILFPLPDREVSDPNPMVMPDSPLGLHGDAVYLSPAPLYHTSPVVTGTIVHRYGGTVVVMKTWDAQRCLLAIETYKCDTAQFVPTMFVRLLKLPAVVRERYDLSSLRQVSHAAAPCPVKIKQRMMQWWGPIIWEFYAGSENVGSTSIGPTEWLEHPGSVGRGRFCQVHICGDDGVDLPTGEIGDIWFDTPTAKMEYHHNPEATAAAMNDRGWYTMGDVGRLDEDGYLYLLDRRSFMIISGGVNVYPQEAENVLIMHDAVADVAVIGVPDDDLGEVAKAIVEVADGVTADAALAAGLLDFCAQQLAPYKCPRSVDFTDTLPRQDTGKLYKRLLRDRYWGDRESRIV